MSRGALAAFALALLAAFALLRYRSGGYYSRSRRLLLVALRLGALAGLAVVAAGLARTGQPPPPGLVVLADVSASISPERAAARDDFLERLRRGLPGADRLRVIRFAAAAAAEPEPSGTDIAGAIGVAQGLREHGRRAALLILSDGEETTGAALATAEGVGASGTPVFAYDLSSPAQGPAEITRVSAPRRVIPLERFEVAVAVAGGAAPQVQVRLACADGAGEVRSVHVAGRRETDVAFLLQAPRAGRLRCRVQLEDAAGRPLPADARPVDVPVAPSPPVTLLTENPRESGGLKEMLERAGLEVQLSAPEDWRMRPDPAAHPGVIVLDNLPVPAIGAEGLAKLERLVRARGAGLLVFGGVQSLGAGGYAGTALEEVLPVAMEPPASGADADLGLVIVLDTSLSMHFQGAGGSTLGDVPRKIELAKAAVLEIVQALRPGDRFGLLESHDRLVWARRPAPVGDREQLEARIARIRALGGGINFYSSIREAFESLRDDPAKIRHVMVLADANDIDQVEVESAGRSADLAREMADARVTLSIFALGFPSDKDVAFLRQMTQIGRGDFYLVANTLSLPRYFRSEYQKKTGERFREGEIAPIVRSAAPALRGLDTERLPQLGGLNLVAAKTGAEEVLGTAAGAPLFVVWKHGRGRSAVFASDSGVRWAGQWLAWSEAERFWAQLIHELALPEAPAAIEVRATAVDGRLRLLLRRRDGLLLPPGPGEVRYGEAAAAPPTPLERRGLHLFEADLPPGEGRSRTFRVGGEPVRGQGDVSGVLELPAPAEYRPAGRGRALLDTLVQGTGGAWVAGPEEVLDRLAALEKDLVPVVFWVVLLVMFCLGAELLARY